MKSQLLYACVLACSVFISSCAIEKRHYTGGYHVESFWNGQVESTILNRSAFGKSNGLALSARDNAAIAELLVQPDTVRLRSTVLSEERNQLNTETAVDSVSREKQLTEKFVLNVQQAEEHLIPAPDPEKRSLESMGFLSALVALIGFFVPVGAIFFFISAIIAGSYSQKKIRENPEKYMGRGFGLVGFLLGVFGLITILWILFATGVFAT
jgi:hypothetical protein